MKNLSDGPFYSFLFEAEGAEGGGGAGTPPSAENDGNTPDSAENESPDTPADEAAKTEGSKKKAADAIPKDNVEKLIKERLERQEKQLRSQWEAERKKAEERSKMEASERLEAEKKDLEAERQKLQAELEATRQEMTIRDALTSKVRSVPKAMRLFDKEKHMTADGEIDIEAFLEDFPEEAPATAEGGDDEPAPQGVKVPSARSGKPAQLTREAISKMSAEEYEKRRGEILDALREGRIR